MSSVADELLGPRPVGTSILDQLVEVDVRSLSEGMARKILEIGFDEAQRRRVAVLAEKSQAGELTPQDRAEYDEFIHVADLLARLQSKARRALQRSKPTRAAAYGDVLSEGSQARARSERRSS